MLVAADVDELCLTDLYDLLQVCIHTPPSLTHILNVPPGNLSSTLASVVQFVYFVYLSCPVLYRRSSWARWTPGGVYDITLWCL